MSNLETSLKLNKICRSCLTEEGIMTSIFENDREPQILKMFENFTSIEVKKGDGLTSIICNNCILRLQDSYQFQQMCIQSDFTLRNILCTSEKIMEDYISLGINYNQNVLIECKDAANFDDSSCSNKKEGYLETNIEDVEQDCFKEFYHCNVCFEKFSTIANLEQHKMNLHMINKLCTLCGSTFISSNGETMNHKCIQVTNKSSSSKKYGCKECDKEYTSAHNLQHHMYIHSGIKPYSCEYCKKTFSTQISLKSHKSVHTGHFPYLCSECGKGFSTLTGLKRHKVSHSGIRPFVCKVCPSSFAASGDLLVHMRCHTGEKPYLCPTCGKCFSRISHLNTHVRIHTGEKPYKCSRCDKAFAQSGDLRSHERTHTGEKPYVCNICNKRFIQSSGLAMHMRTHTGEKLFKCSMCYKAFSQASSLNRHQRCHNK